MRILLCEVDRPLTRLAILGSTGSVGCQTLDVVRAHPERFEVVALAGGSNLDILARQIAEFHPRYVCSAADGLCERLGGSPAPQFVSRSDIAGPPETHALISPVV